MSEPIPYPYLTVACDFCGRPIIWAVTVNDKQMPVDAGLDPAGNATLTPVPGRKPLVKVLGPALRTQYVERLRMPHVVSCPRRDAWRFTGYRPPDSDRDHADRRFHGRL